MIGLQMHPSNTPCGRFPTQTGQGHVATTTTCLGVCRFARWIQVAASRSTRVGGMAVPGRGGHLAAIRTLGVACGQLSVAGLRVCVGEQQLCAALPDTRAYGRTYGRAYSR